MAGNYKGKNSTANNALEILNLFTVEQKTITAIQIANHLQTSRSTAYRYLDTLLEMNFLAEDPAGGYRIGRRIQELAMLDRDSDRALVLAQSWLLQLRDEFDETTTYTARLGGIRTVIRASESSNRLLRVSYDLGTVMPLYAGAPSLVLLFGDTDEQVRSAFSGVEIEPYTDDTPRTVQDVLRIVNAIRRHGFYVSRGEYDRDSVSVGVPVFGDEPTKPVAGLGIVLPSSRSTPDREANMVDRLRHAAEDINRQLLAG